MSVYKIHPEKLIEVIIQETAQVAVDVLSYLATLSVHLIRPSLRWFREIDEEL